MIKLIDCKGCGRKMGIPTEILTPTSRNQSLFGREIQCMDCGDKSYYKLSDGDQGNDTLGMGNPDKEVCKHCQEVIISFNAGADDFDYADVAEAIDQHVCHQRKHDDDEAEKASDAAFKAVEPESYAQMFDDSLNGKPDPVTVEVTWAAGMEERNADVSITAIVSYIDELLGIGMTSICINEVPHDDFFSMITDKDSICAVEDQHGEPYCHTHKCGPTDPCIVKGCPHCIGEQIASFNDVTKDNYILLSKKLEDLEMSVAKGEESDDVDQQMQAIDKMLSESRWTRDMDTGEVIPTPAASKDYANSVEAFERG